MPHFDDLIDHPRESWQDPLEPVQSTNLFEWADISQIVFHYTGAINLPDGDPGEDLDDVARLLRNTQHWYLTDPRRGYSIGYNLAVDWSGGIWELRGDDFECAANLGVNEWSFAVLQLVDGNDRASEAMAAANREIVQRAREVSGIQLPLRGHGTNSGSATITPCPGTGIIQDLAEGRFEPLPIIVPPPPPPPPPPTPPDLTLLGGSDMLRLSRLKGAHEFYLSNGIVSLRKTGDQVDYLILKGRSDIKDLVSPANELKDRTSVSEAPRGSIEAFGQIIDF